MILLKCNFPLKHELFNQKPCKCLWSKMKKKKKKRTPKPNNETNLKFTIESLDLAQMDLNWNIAAYGTEPKYLVLG